ncbi:MAG: hypothetical protein J6X91_06505 [Bacteroidales bacterium]|nr:hypothetical protein [Bacteroidales bacterium]MBP5518288.1 hypothetical protein [Bacteroidales bacterium]
MKKFLYLAVVAAAGLFLVSCSSSGLKPTGDPEKDAKALVDYQTQANKDALDALTSLKLSKASQISEEAKKVAETFTKFYEGKPELKAKFDEAVATFTQESLEKIGENLKDSFGGLFSDAEDKVEEAAEAAGEAVQEAAEAVENAAEKVAE